MADGSDETKPGPTPACPACRAVGRGVDAVTVRAIATHDVDAAFAATARFCRSLGCRVVYYDSAGRTVAKGQVIVRVGVKEDEDPIPICYCFGFTRAHVRADVERTGASTIAERIAIDVKAGRCDCEQKNPAGVCCLGEVQRVIAAEQGRAR